MRIGTGLTAAAIYIEIAPRPECRAIPVHLPTGLHPYRVRGPCIVIVRVLRELEIGKIPFKPAAGWELQTSRGPRLAACGVVIGIRIRIRRTLPGRYERVQRP